MALTCKNVEEGHVENLDAQARGFAHNPEVAGSNPAPATNVFAGQGHDQRSWPFCFQDPFWRDSGDLERLRGRRGGTCGLSGPGRSPSGGITSRTPVRYCEMLL